MIKIGSIIASIRTDRSWRLYGRLGCLVVVTLGALYLIRDRSEESVVERSGSRVEVAPLKPSAQAITVSGYGTVEPSRTLDVRPLVSGHVVKIHPQLEEGGRIGEMDVLVGIDPRDYQIEITARKADLARAEADLKMEQGNQLIAKREWALLGKRGDLSESNRELALRLPIIKEKEAALLAAESQLQRAELNLERTSVTAPFSSIVLAKGVEIGGIVDPGTVIAKLAATDRFYVKVLIGDDQLQWIDFNAQSPRNAELHNVVVSQIQGGTSHSRPGRLQRVLGSVDSAGRMVQILVAIDNPLQAEEGTSPLLLGAYVKVELSGSTVKEVYRIPRRALRAQNKVWVADRKNRLRSRVPEIIYSSDDVVLARGGFQPGDRLVVSTPETALEGARLEIAKEASEL